MEDIDIREVPMDKIDKLRNPDYYKAFHYITPCENIIYDPAENYSSVFFHDKSTQVIQNPLQTRLIRIMFPNILDFNKRLHLFVMNTLDKEKISFGDKKLRLIMVLYLKSWTMIKEFEKFTEFLKNFKSDVVTENINIEPFFKTKAMDGEFLKFQQMVFLYTEKNKEFYKVLNVLDIKEPYSIFFLMALKLTNTLLKEIEDKPDEFVYSEEYYTKISCIKEGFLISKLKLRDQDYLESERLNLEKEVRRVQASNAGKARSKKYEEVKSFVFDEYKNILTRDPNISNNKASFEIVKKVKSDFKGKNPVPTYAMQDTFRKWLGEYKKNNNI